MGTGFLMGIDIFHGYGFKTVKPSGFVPVAISTLLRHCCNIFSPLPLLFSIFNRLFKKLTRRIDQTIEIEETVVRHIHRMQQQRLPDQVRTVNGGKHDCNGEGAGGKKRRPSRPVEFYRRSTAMELRCEPVALLCHGGADGDMLTHDISIFFKKRSEKKMKFPSRNLPTQIARAGTPHYI
jgi:hypothetical protein